MAYFYGKQTELEINLASKYLRMRNIFSKANDVVDIDDFIEREKDALLG